MKSRMLMIALVAVMLMGVRTYAHDCGPCSEVNPCGACNGCAKSCDLFSGLKRLAACRPCDAGECGPCDAIVACTPCGETNCDPCGSCGDIGCDDGCGRKFAFGSRLKSLFASKTCNPCDACGPCDESACGPCDDASRGPCDDTCGPCDSGRKFSLRNLFKGFGKLSCSCGDDCGPCDGACNACDACGADKGSGPCDACGACDNACDPCGACDGCGKKFGRLFDKPRQGLKKFFDGFRFGKCGECGPCDPCGSACDPCGNCNPCDTVCGSPCSSLNAHGNGEAAAPQLPEAAK